MINNPFNITFGKEPSSIISRNDDLKEVYDSFSSIYPNTQVYILTGILGSGKTVAMTTISEYYKNNNWITLELNPECDMLEQLASKLYDEGKLKKYFIKAEFDFSFKGIGFNLIGSEVVTNISTILKKEFEILKKIRVLITIDEVISNNYMRIFAHEYQTFMRQGFDCFLLMTGLYQNISSLEKEKSLTFLYRAPKIYLGELNIMSIANSYIKIFNVSDRIGIKFAKYTSGYAFAYQLLGNLLYETNKKDLDHKIIKKYDEILYERSYSVIFDELTTREREILMESLTGENNENIMLKTGISKSQLSQYKKQLKLKGIIKESRESIKLSLPRFKEFLEFIKIYNEV